MPKKVDYLKSMFDFCKGLGQFSQYENFEDYNQRKFGVTNKPTLSEKVKGIPLEDLEEFAETIKPQEKEKFEDTLNEKDKADFKFMFGKEDG